MLLSSQITSLLLAPGHLIVSVQTAGIVLLALPVKLTINKVLQIMQQFYFHLTHKT